MLNIARNFPNIREVTEIGFVSKSSNVLAFFSSAILRIVNAGRKINIAHFKISNRGKREACPKYIKLELENQQTYPHTQKNKVHPKYSAQELLMDISSFFIIIPVVVIFFNFELPV